MLLHGSSFVFLSANEKLQDIKSKPKNSAQMVSLFTLLPSTVFC